MKTLDDIKKEILIDLGIFNEPLWKDTQEDFIVIFNKIAQATYKAIRPKDYRFEDKPGNYTGRDQEGDRLRYQEWIGRGKTIADLDKRYKKFTSNTEEELCPCDFDYREGGKKWCDKHKRYAS